MNLETWIEKWKKETGFERNDYKQMPSFKWSLRESLHQVTCPLSLIEEIDRDFPHFQVEDGRLEISAFLDEMSTLRQFETLAIKGNWKGTVMYFSFRINHGEKEVEYSYVFHSSLTVSTSEIPLIHAFCHEMYEMMKMFLETFSPYRLEFISHSYEYSIQEELELP